MIRLTSVTGAVVLAMMPPLAVAQGAAASPQTAQAPRETLEQSLRLEVESAALRSDSELGATVLDVRLRSSSRRAFARFTDAHVGRTIDVRHEELSLTRPRILSAIPGGMLSIALPATDPAVFSGRIAEIATRLRNGTGVLEVRLLPCTEGDCPAPEAPRE